MLPLEKVTGYLETIAPLHYQESFDNAGLLTGHKEQDVTGILVSLDITEEVVNEAVEGGYNMIVAHHPVIFSPLKKLTGSNHVERTVEAAISNNIALYASHTNLDNTPQGVNDKIAAKLMLRDREILAPKEGVHTEEEPVGLGMVGNLSKPMNEEAFLDTLAASMKLECFKYTPLQGKTVERVAVCGGAGGFLLENAVAAGADFFISSDFKYHDFFNAEGRIVIADIGHYESEVFTKELLQQFLSEKFSSLPVKMSDVNTNPVRYWKHR